MHKSEPFFKLLEEVCLFLRKGWLQETFCMHRMKDGGPSYILDLHLCRYDDLGTMQEESTKKQ